MVRLQKFLADAGVASRRAGEQFILEGRVMVNGAVVRLLGSKINPAHDKVSVDGKFVTARNKIYLALHRDEHLCFRVKRGDCSECSMPLKPDKYYHLIAAFSQMLPKCGRSFGVRFWPS